MQTALKIFLLALCAPCNAGAAMPAPVANGQNAATATAQADAGGAALARRLLEGMLDLQRGTSSVGEMTMTVVRPDWQKTTTLKAWTRGREDALIRFTAPAKDAGNATLKKGREMWTFTPKINKVLRLPTSLMSQSWAGSDFSYNDLARSDELLVHYDLQLLGQTEQDGHRVYTIEARPHADAPVVWGKEVMKLRDDHVMLEAGYYDQGMALVKRLVALKVEPMGGRTIATRLRMEDMSEKGHATELQYQNMQFNAEVGDETFTQFALRNGVAEGGSAAAKSALDAGTTDKRGS